MPISVSNIINIHSQSLSCVHGIFQVRILKWVAISYFRRSSRTRDWTCISCVSCTGRWILYHRATWVGSLRWGEIPWRREWTPTPVFLPGELHGQKSLAGYSQWGCKEADRTEQLTLLLLPGKPQSLPDKIF